MSLAHIITREHRSAPDAYFVSISIGGVPRYGYEIDARYAVFGRLLHLTTGDGVYVDSTIDGTH
ncbi:hypothetical protein LPJ61_004393, partial [Coemansia biformis]